MRTALLIGGLLAALMGGLFSCKKQKDGSPTPVPVDTATIPRAQDPAVAGTIGFFLNDWQGKTFKAPDYTDTLIPATADYTVTVDAGAIITKVPVSLFGNNSNPYMTQMITEVPLMTHLTNLRPHLIRFPGGNISSVYFWNTGGPQPADAPDSLLDSDGKAMAGGYWYGKNTAGWTLSLDNYYQMLQQTGSEGVITINYAYARYGASANPVATAAHLAADWVRTDNGRTRYWEIGNESGGVWQAGYRIDVSKNKDGQPEIITGPLYGQHFQVFADSMKSAAKAIGKTIYIGAQLLDAAPASWQTATDKGWNAGVFANAGNAADFYIVHDYFTPYNTNSNATDILNTAISVPQNAMSYVQQNAQVNGASVKPIALTEWNIFAVGSRQMVSHVAGMHAVLTLGELLKNKFGEASRWDLANGWSNGDDQGMFNNGDEPDGVSRWNPRPVFYHMYYFQKYLGDRLVSSSVSNNNTTLSSYASTFSSGETGLTLVNRSTASQSVQVTVKNFRAGSRFYWFTLSGGTDNGEFSGRVFVNGQGPSGANGGPANYTSVKAYSAGTQDGIRVKVPARSVVIMVIDKK